MIPHEHYRGCGCAHKDVFATRCTDAEFAGDVADLYSNVVMRTESGNPVRVFKAEPGIDDFAADEDLIAALMSDAIFQRGKTVREAVDEAIATYGWNPDRIMEALESVQSEMSNVFEDIEEDVTSAVSRTINTGAAGIAIGATTGTVSSSVGAGTVFEGYNSVANMRDGIVRAARYSTNGFFNNEIIPAIQREIQSIMESAGAFEPTVFPSIREVLGSRLKSVPYWRVVANAAASRGYHYGYLKAAGILQYTTYRFVAIIDDRTSQVCRQMNGREFQVAQGVSLMERVANAESVEEVKTITPWLRPAQVENLTNAELAASGFMLPPLHGNCRSTISIS